MIFLEGVRAHPLAHPLGAGRGQCGKTSTEPPVCCPFSCLSMETVSQVIPKKKFKLRKAQNKLANEKKRGIVRFTLPYFEKVQMVIGGTGPTPFSILP